MTSELGTALVREEAITVRNGPVALGGTLLLPRQDAPCPGVVLVHGSGDDTRDDYRVFAQYFAERGIAALIYDKRGVGESSGTWRRGSFAELAGDALAGVEALAGQAGVDAARVGLWGCSEGGWVVPLAAARAPGVAFVVAVSAAGMSPAGQEQYRRGLLIAERGRSRLARAWGQARVGAMFGILRHTPKPLLPGIAGYFSRTMDFDPLPVWRAVTQPVLLVYGAADRAVPPDESARLIAAALRGAGHDDLTIERFAGADHGIQVRDEATGERRFAPGYLAAVASWMLAR